MRIERSDDDEWAVAAAACRTHPVRKEGFEEGIFRSWNCMIVDLWRQLWRQSKSFPWATDDVSYWSLTRFFSFTQNRYFE